MLKKIFVMLLAFLFCLTMGSCASQTSDPQDTETERDPNQESTSESEEESETEFTDQPVDDSELVPAYEGTKAEITHTDIYNDCILVTVQDTTKAEYETYLETLLSFSNYTEIVSPREILGNTGNLASMYTKQTAEGNYLINVLWIPEEKSVYGVGEVKITVEPLHDTDLSVFDPASATTGSVESLLIQIGVDEYGAIGSVVEGAPETAAAEEEMTLEQAVEAARQYMESGASAAFRIRGKSAAPSALRSRWMSASFAREK